MRRAEVIARILRAVELAEPHLPAGIGFSDGWRDRGRDGFAPRGCVNHTTEDAGPLPWPTLYRILRDGHGQIAGNAICNEAIRHDTGRIVIIAAGTAWHAGAGGWRDLRGNPSVWGREIQRGQGQVLTEVQLRPARVMDWALTEAFGWPPADVCDHHEWAPTRKADRRVRDGVSMSGAVWRASIVAPDPQPEPDPWETFMATLTEQEQRDLRSLLANRPVLRQGDRGNDVRLLQRGLRAWMGATRRDSEPHHRLNADGVFGPYTVAALREWQRAANRPQTGEADPVAMAAMAAYDPNRAPS